MDFSILCLTDVSHFCFSQHVGARDMTMSLFHNFKLKRAKVDSRPSIDIENGPEPFTELIGEHQEDQSDGWVDFIPISI